MAESLSSLDEDDNLLDTLHTNGKPSVDSSPSQFSSIHSKLDSKPRRRSSIRPSLETDELLNLLHGSDPVKVELNRLENEVRDKDRELIEALSEIKALKLAERQKEKAVDELYEELQKVDEKLKATEILLDNKNLEIKRINDERKAALAAQFAAEATLRRVHAAQKDADLPQIEAILAPLEAELKLTRQEVAKLQEDNRALDRLTKTKEAALLEAEKSIHIAEAKASTVEDLQNRNQELLKQIENYQEEKKTLDKMHRQKVAEVEKLSIAVAELEEALLAGGAAANAVRDYERQVHQLMDEKKTLERELSRVKITANRVAVVVANEWKDANDKVMPVRQWLEERRFMQGEMQQLRDKLACVERTARNELQLKEKYQLRLKVLEEGLKAPVASRRMVSVDESLRSTLSRRQSTGSEDAVKLLANGHRRPRLSTLQSKASITVSTIFKNGKFTSKSFDGGRSAEGATREKAFVDNVEDFQTTDQRNVSGVVPSGDPLGNSENLGNVESSKEFVSSLLYDILQKEVILLRKASHEKDQSLKDKDDAIEMLSKKVDTLTKAMEVEAKKMRREVAAMEKEVAALRVDRDQDSRARRLSTSKGMLHSSSQLLAGRALQGSVDGSSIVSLVHSEGFLDWEKPLGISFAEKYVGQSWMDSPTTATMERKLDPLRCRKFIDGMFGTKIRM